MFKENLKYTEKGLPIVTQQTIYAYCEGCKDLLELAQVNQEKFRSSDHAPYEFFTEGVDLHAKLIICLIHLNNPTTFTVQDLKIQLYTAFMIGAQELYAILEKQAEANRLEERSQNYN